MFEKSWIQVLKSSKISLCHFSSTEEVRTKCFSRRLIRGVGNFSYTVSFSAIRISLFIGKQKLLASLWGWQRWPLCTGGIHVSHQFKFYVAFAWPFICCQKNAQWMHDSIHNYNYYCMHVQWGKKGQNITLVPFKIYTHAFYGSF